MKKHEYLLILKMIITSKRFLKLRKEVDKNSILGVIFFFAFGIFAGKYLPLPPLTITFSAVFGAVFGSFLPELFYIVWSYPLQLAKYIEEKEKVKNNPGNSPSLPPRVRNSWGNLKYKKS